MIRLHNAKNDIKWWIAHAKNSKRRLSHGNATITLYTDASNQGWAKFTTFLVARPVLLPQASNIVNLPFNPETKHPLWKKLRLMGCLLSGNPWQTKAFRTELKQSSLTHGDQVRKNSTKFISESGTSLQVKEVLIPFSHL